MIDAGASSARLAFDGQLAFADSIEPLLPIAFRLAFAMLRDRDEAEDAVQEAAMKAWQKRRTFRPGAEPRPWFLAIVANECRMARRRRRWSSIDQVRVKPDTRGDDPMATEEADQLRRALARLAHADRLVLVLRFYLDFSNEEVARTLGISAGAARVRVHRALNRLRPEIRALEVLLNG